MAVLLLGCTAEATPAPARSTAAAGADDPVDSGSGRLCSTPRSASPSGWSTAARR
ncbi:hypothetical protein ACFQ0M_29980 [Kitasatospora aburaviensis]